MSGEDTERRIGYKDLMDAIGGVNNNIQSVKDVVIEQGADLKNNTELTKKTHEALYGNGDPSQGLVSQLAAVTTKTNENSKSIGRIFIWLGGISLTVLGAAYTAFSMGIIGK